MADLKTRWYPDIEHSDVDNSDEHSCCNHDTSWMFTIGDDDPNSVDDDLQQQLNLDTPPEEDSEVECKAFFLSANASEHRSSLSYLD